VVINTNPHIKRVENGVWYTNKHGVLQLLDPKTLYSFANDVMRRFGKHKVPVSDVEDVVQSMVEYSLYAMERWEPSRKCNVSTFLYHCMWNALRKFLDKFYREQKHLTQNIRNFENWVNELFDGGENNYE